MIKKNEHYKFYFSILAVLLYETLFQIVNPPSNSGTKIVITLLVWISFYLSFSFFISNFKYVKANFPSWVFTVFMGLLLWNFVNIGRSFLNDEGTVTTLFGNSSTSLALLVPFSLFFGLSAFNLGVINKFLINVIILCLIISLVLFLFFNFEFKKPNNFIFLLISKTTFLITLVSFQKSKDKVVILIGIIILLYLSILVGNRTMLMRVTLLFSLIFCLSFYKYFKRKWILFVPFLILFVPFYLLQTSVSTGESAFEKYLSKSKSSEMSTDTRTFLYIETFEDLVENKSLIYGKGSNATYYSEYFTYNAGDSNYRLSVEVGILAILLKGGLIAVVLNLILLISAIYLAFFKSENFIVVGVGFILLIHTFLLFVENVVSYSVYNFAIWFFVGVCLSKEIRGYNTKQIKYFLRNVR